MKDNFDIYAWNKNRRLEESIGEKMSLNDQRVEAVAKAISKTFDITNDGYLKGTIRVALADFIEENLDESTQFLQKLASNLAEEFPNLSFEIRFPGKEYNRIDVRGSQQDMHDWGDKFHGKKFGEYEVFHTDDDDQGEIVRIVKSKEIAEEGTCGYTMDAETGKKLKTIGGLEETIKFIKENNPEFTTEEILTELKEIKELGSQLQEESKLCKRGRDYIAARKRAGEKSSAYLSGRAVKVCKGQMSGKKKE